MNFEYKYSIVWRYFFLLETINLVKMFFLFIKIYYNILDNNKNSNNIAQVGVINIWKQFMY